MKTITLSLLALALPLAAQERPEPIRMGTVRMGTVRTFARSCEYMRPIAVRVAVKHGWKVDASKQGNITAPEGVIRFASGERDCDVTVKSANRGESAILESIATQLRKK